MGLPALCSPAAAMVYDKDLVWRSCVLMTVICFVPEVSPSNCLNTQHAVTTAPHSSLQTGLLLHTIANNSTFCNSVITFFSKTI